MSYWKKEKTQIPYAYTDLAFTCKPSTTKKSSLNFGQLFQGDRIQESGIYLEILKPVTPTPLCKEIKLEDSQALITKDLIYDQYHVEWLLDGLPSAGFINDHGEYYIGFPLGMVDSNATSNVFVNNYLQIKVDLSVQKQTEKYSIVGFTVSAGSVHVDKECKRVSKPQKPITDEKEIQYCYSVEWVIDNSRTWWNRWERYIDLSTSKPARWISLANSLMLFTAVTVTMGYFLISALRRDISNYNDIEDKGDLLEESIGWKLVHRDVFRSPRKVNFLASFIGTGVQIILTIVLTTFLTIIGILNPSYRGGTVQLMIFSYAFSSAFGGYYCARLFKTFKGSPQVWINSTLLTGILFPFIVFVLICILNTMFWDWNSSLALPAGTFVALLAIWIFISLPLTILGGYFGNKKQPYEHPVRVNQIPRQVPAQPVYLKLIPSALIGGLIPFLIMYLELSLIWKSAWASQYFYMYGFVIVAALLAIIAMIEITLGIIYFQLIAEDYRWQWKSFWIGASPVWYMFFLGIYYFSAQGGEFSSWIYFFINNLIISVASFVAMGTIGFFASYAFMTKIYSALKVD